MCSDNLVKLMDNYHSLCKWTATGYHSILEGLPSIAQVEEIISHVTEE